MPAMEHVFWAADDGERSATGAIPERAAIAETDRWDLTVLYPDDEAWEADFVRIDELVAPLQAMRGTLNSPEAVLAFLVRDTELDRLTHKVYVYAHLKADENTADTVNQARLDRVRALAGKKALSVPQIAMAYVMNQPLNVFALVGCANGDEFAANVDALSAELTPDEMAWLDLQTDEEPE